MQYIFFSPFFICLLAQCHKQTGIERLRGWYLVFFFFFFLFVSPAEMSGQARRKKNLEELTIKTSACGINYRQECSLPDRPKKKMKEKKNEIDGNTKLARQTHWPMSKCKV